MKKVLYQLQYKRLPLCTINAVKMHFLSTILIFALSHHKVYVMCKQGSVCSKTDILANIPENMNVHWFVSLGTRLYKHPCVSVCCLCSV